MIIINLGIISVITALKKQYENYLRGEKGYNYVLVDSRRKEIGKYKNGTDDVPSIKGDDLVLTIDADVQRVAEEELKGKRGAAVAIEPKTGEMLALASSPNYDLNEFSYVTSKEFLQKLYNDPDKPLFNRATMSIKPPGSTFKILAAIAALDLGVIDYNYYFLLCGYFTYGRVFKCDAVHGTLNVEHAIEHSCNVFFYNLIFKIGIGQVGRICKKIRIYKGNGN